MVGASFRCLVACVSVLPLISAQVFAAPPAQQWSLTIDAPGTSMEMPQVVKIDRSGALYVAATHYQVGSAASWDIVTSRVSAQGTLLWQSTFDGGYLDQAADIAVYGTDAFTFGSAYVSPTVYDLIVLRYSASGTLLWKSVVSLGAALGARAITVADSGDIYFAGDAIITPTDVDWVVGKIRGSDGALMWLNTWSGSMQLQDRPSDIVVDSAENVYVAGGEILDATTSNAVVVSYAKTGGLRWTSSRAQSYPSEMAVDSNGNIAWGGTTNLGGIAARKIDSSGVTIWDATYVAPAFIGETHMALGRNGAVIVVGEEGWPDTNWRVVSFDSSWGGLQWSTDYQGPNPMGLTDVPHSIATDRAGNIYVAGDVMSYFISSQGLDVESDMALVKFSPLGVMQWEALSSGKSGQDDSGQCVVANRRTGLVTMIGQLSSAVDPMADLLVVSY